MLCTILAQTFENDMGDDGFTSDLRGKTSFPINLLLYGGLYDNLREVPDKSQHCDPEGLSCGKAQEKTDGVILRLLSKGGEK